MSATLLQDEVRSPFPFIPFFFPFFFQSGPCSPCGSHGTEVHCSGCSGNNTAGLILLELRPCLGSGGAAVCIPRGSVQGTSHRSRHLGCSPSATQGLLCRSTAPLLPQHIAGARDISSDCQVAQAAQQPENLDCCSQDLSFTAGVAVLWWHGSSKTNLLAFNLMCKVPTDVACRMQKDQMNVPTSCLTDRQHQAALHPAGPVLVTTGISPEDGRGAVGAGVGKR